MDPVTRKFSCAIVQSTLLLGLTACEPAIMEGFHKISLPTRSTSVRSPVDPGSTSGQREDPHAAVFRGFDHDGGEGFNRAMPPRVWTRTGFTQFFPAPDSQPNLRTMVVESVSPSSGPLGGGTTLDILGRNFPRDAVVEIGMLNHCLSVTFISATHLRCVTPPHFAFRMLSDIFEETAGRLVPGPELANLTSHLEVSVAERRVGLDWLQTRSGQNYASLEDGFSYAIPEAWFASPQGRVRSSSPVFGPALRIDLTNGFWQTLGRDTASVQEVWRNAAEARITARTQLRLAGDDPAHPHHEWGPAETAMNQASTAAMVDSVNRLERRYPQAFPQSSAAFEELYVAAMNARAQNSEKHLQKEAAIRFMDRVRLNFGDDIASGYTMPLAREGGELRVGLHVRQYLSLAWFAVNDAQIFNEEEVMRRKAGLIESLARIQRAHNDHGPGDAILWDPAAESDAPSCFLGTLKFIFESLNHHHPDVLGINPAESAVIAETTAGEVSAPGGGAMPAMADVSRDVRLENLRLFPIFWATLSEEDQVELEAQIEEYGEEIEELDTFKAYLQQLREAVRESLPRVTEEVLIQQTSPHVMLALLAEALDHCENSSDLGALAR